MEQELSMSDIKQNFAELGEYIKNIAQESERRSQEADKRNVEAEKRSKEIDKKIKELGKQIGGLGDRFGSFTEGMAINSMEKILRRQFKADHVVARSKVYSKTDEILAEYDILAWCNGEHNNVVVVEVKSTLRQDYVMDFEKALQEFKGLNPDMANKNLYGILAFVGNFDRKIEDFCQKKGIYTATIHDEIFKLNASKNTFQPKNFNEK